MKKLLRTAILTAAAVAALLGWPGRAMAIEQYHPVLLPTGPLAGGRATGLYTNNPGGGLLGAIGEVHNDGEIYAAFWRRTPGGWRLIRLSGPGVSATANAVTSVRRQGPNGPIDIPVIVGSETDANGMTTAVMWDILYYLNDRVRRTALGPNSEARGIIAGSFSAGGDTGSLIVVGTRDGDDQVERAILWTSDDLTPTNFVARVLPDEGAGAEADTIARLPNGEVVVGGCVVDLATGEEVGCVWHLNDVGLSILRRLPEDDGPNHLYGMSGTGNYAVGVQFPPGYPAWPMAWGMSPSGEWGVIELNNTVNWGPGISASLNAVNSRGRAGGYAGGYAGDSLTRGFILDITAMLSRQRAFMAIDTVDPDDRGGLQIEHVAAVADNNAICGWGTTPDMPGVSQPFVSIPNPRIHKTDLLYASAEGYAGTPIEVGSWWADKWYVTRSSMPGSDTVTLRGRVNGINAQEFDRVLETDLIATVVSRLQGSHGDHVRQMFCLWNFETWKYDMIASDVLRGGSHDQANRYHVAAADLAPYVSGGTIWYHLEWTAGPVHAVAEGFSVDVDEVTLRLR